MRTPDRQDRERARQRPNEFTVMHQAWRDLLFLHWEWDPGDLQSRLPKGLHLDTFEGRAFLGIVPFFMDAIRPAFLPPLPGLSWFMELNVRTYVHSEDGTPGVWFFSLDCNQSIAVKIARSCFSLPYQHARMTSLREPDGTVRYQSLRIGSGRPSSYRYLPRGNARPCQPGTLEFFLLERYWLFASRRGRLYRGQVHHPPYGAWEVSSYGDGVDPLFELNGFKPPGRPADHVIGSPGVQVEVFGLQPAD